MRQTGVDTGAVRMILSQDGGLRPLTDWAKEIIPLLCGEIDRMRLEAKEKLNSWNTLRSKLGVSCGCAALIGEKAHFWSSQKTMTTSSLTRQGVTQLKLNGVQIIISLTSGEEGKRPQQGKRGHIQRDPPLNLEKRTQVGQCSEQQKQALG